VIAAKSIASPTAGFAGTIVRSERGARAAIALVPQLIKARARRPDN
jgi:hypothetical protein